MSAPWSHGVPSDTPEVAAAKAAHFAAHAAAASHGHVAAPVHSYGHSYAPEYHGQAYHGPQALPPGYDKHGAPLPVQDTPAVAAEKSHHLSVLAHAGGAIYPAAPYHGDWTDDGHSVHHATNHYAQSPVHYAVPAYQALPRPVHDTPEVAAAKAAHFAAHRAAAAKHQPYAATYQRW